jgi:hypothetical protein
VVLVLEQISVVLLVVAVLMRVPIALRRTTYRWLLSACAAMTVSVVIYVSAVLNWVLSDGCGLTVNVWGLGTSTAIAVFSALATGVPRRIVFAILVGYTTLSCLTVYRGLVEVPSPIGCVDRLHLPWYDGFWWLVILVHVSSTGYATVVFRNLLQVAGKKESMHVELRLLAAGMISSTLFWCGVLFILVTGESHLITPLQYLICTTSLFLAGGLSYDFFRRCAERLTAARVYRRLEPLNRYVSLALGEPPMPSPGIVALLWSRGYPPQDRLYRLTVTICDSLLEVVDFSTGRRGGNCDERFTCIHRAMRAEGWRPGDAINTGFALRVMSRLLSPAQRDQAGARLAARLD